MNKKSKKNQKWYKSYKKIGPLLLLLVVVVLASLSFLVAKITYLNQAADQASTAQIRELLVMSLEDLKKDVPVDAKTGDLYFPESSLVLPNPKSDLRLTYAWSPASSDSQEQLSVSLVQIPGTRSLYSAKNSEELFNTLPRVQSCSRGVNIVYNKSNDDSLGQLKKVITLQNNKELYLYLEASCPELENVIDLLSGLQSY